MQPAKKAMAAMMNNTAACISSSFLFDEVMFT